MKHPESEEPNSQVEADVAEVEDIETLKEALAEAKAKAEEYYAGWQRAQADFINYKRRSEQEGVETRKFANTVLILSILPVLDDLERALASIPPRQAKLSWVDGIRLIQRKLQSNLEAQGVSQIKALGETFDPNLHEAARLGRGEEGIVIEELEKGYKLHDKIIRPSKVVVGNGEGEEEKKEE